jgi:TetR/AcrR family transcriptional regulator, repressor for uid operon
MRPASVQLKSDRRLSILDAAERCFARAGFHGASMHDICAEAGMSPGNLYRYFPSKEAIISGICERNRAQAAEDFLAVDQAPGFFAGLAGLARSHLVDRPDEQTALCADIVAECRRNPQIAQMHEEIERDVKTRLVDMLRRAVERGEISSDLDLENAATVLMVLADGMSWRRASDRSFDAEILLPYMMHMVRCLLTHPPRAAGANEEETPR